MLLLLSKARVEDLLFLTSLSSCELIREPVVDMAVMWLAVGGV